MEQETILFQKKIDEKGYVIILVNNKWIKEHRYIVESFIGRELTDKEKIHHDDFCRANNNIENLTLFPDNKSHSHFHRQIKQFGMTNVRIRELDNLKSLMKKERLKNIGVLE